jgi:hypothetical protein
MSVTSPLRFSVNNTEYLITGYPKDTPITLHEIWMRSVARHLIACKVSKMHRLQHFINQFGIQELYHFHRRYAKERTLGAKGRITYKTKAKETLISTRTSNKRAIIRTIRAAKKMKTTQTNINRAVAALVRYGLLKSGGKYDQFRRVIKAISPGVVTYGISSAQYPSTSTTRDIADAIYNHPELLTSTPDWVLRYRKGRLKLVNDTLALPTEQITLSGLDVNVFKTDKQVETAIRNTLERAQMEATCIKVRKQGGVDDAIACSKIAAYVYFETAYHARAAVCPLKSLGRVSLGQTVITARIVASKLINVIKLLLTEADGKFAQELTIEQLINMNEQYNLKLGLQEWIDKDGQVSFIKAKLVDPTFLIFRKGESRVTYLLEFVGDESECRRFYPNLVDQFHICNTTQFRLLNDIEVRVEVKFSSADHKGAWAKTGRSGGHEQRDLYSDFTSASRYHLIVYQDKPNFNYSRHVETWKTINSEMELWKSQQVEANITLTQTAEKVQLFKLYRQYGRVERVPALAYGDHDEQPDVYNKLLITPLVLHNESYCCLITLELGLKYVVAADSKCLNRLQGRLKGLVDGLGTVKCATSGSGIRRLVNDALTLANDTRPERAKYAPLWYLMDTICYHLHLRTRTSDGQHMALMDHERLCFTICTNLWWGLIGDLSHDTGGRILKKRPKNHLEDKIYPYELTNACPEWEEHIKIPLSLIDEAQFEASFSFRDEMINALRSKVGIEAERKIEQMKQIVNKLAPVIQHRSIMGNMSRHLRRNIIVLGCWRHHSYKWSFNFGTGLLPRIAKYSYHNRVTFSEIPLPRPGGPHSNQPLLYRAIHFDIKGPLETFYSDDAIIPDLIIDPCGHCDTTQRPTAFPLSLKTWWIHKRWKRILTLFALKATKATRLKVGHIKRAHKFRETLDQQLQQSTRMRSQTIMDIKETHDAYVMYQTRYPTELSEFTVTSQLQTILQKAQKLTSKTTIIWDGDFTLLPNKGVDVATNRQQWTNKLLKSVLRFFRLHGVRGSQVQLSGKKKALITRVQPLLITYANLVNAPAAYS